MTLAFTDRAKEKVKSFIDAGQGKNPVLRIRISGRNLSGFSYQFFLEGEGDKRPDDQECEIGSFRVRTSGEHAKDLVGASVDWVEDASGSGFKVANPNPPMPHLKGTPAERIQQVIEAEINPSIAAHGGSAEVVDYKDGGKLYLRLSGGCQGCGMAAATLKQGIEARLRELFPEIREVIDATDHAAGENPYFTH